MSASVIRDADPHCDWCSRSPDIASGDARAGRFRVHRPRRLTLFLLLSLAVHALLLLILPQRSLSLPRLAPRPGGLPALSARLMPIDRPPAPRPRRAASVQTGAAPATHPPLALRAHPATRVRAVPARRHPVLAQKRQAVALRVAVALMAPDQAKAKRATPARALSRHPALARTDNGGPRTPGATPAKGARNADTATHTERASAPALPSRRPPQPDGAAVRAVIARALHARFSYPYLARRNGWQGEVDLGLRVEGNGRIAHIRIIKSSGFGILDRAALANAGHIQSLSGLVHLLYGHAIDLVLPVQYRLSES